MQTEEQASNDNKFDHEFCFVTADGELKQKDNRLFKGKTLETGVEDGFEEKAAAYTEAFENLKKEVEAAVTENTSGFTDDQKSALLKKLEEAKAVGDFDSLADLITGHTVKSESAAGESAPESETSKEPEEVTAEMEKPEEAVAKDEPEAKKEAAEQKTVVAEASKSVTDEPAPEPKASKEPEEAKKPDSTEAKDEAEAKKEEATEAKKSSDDASEAEGQDKEDDETELTPLEFYEKLADRAHKIKDINNWKTAAQRLNEIREKWDSGPETEEGTDLSGLKSKLTEAEKHIDDQKIRFQNQQEEKKAKNLAYREELLARIQKIVDDKKWKAQGELNSLQRKFENVRPLPKEGAQDQEKKLKELIAIFDDNRVGYLVEVRQVEEDNLTGKLITIEKMEKIATDAGEATDDWNKLNTELEKLDKQWRKIGRVPKEQEDKLWDRYRKAKDSFLQKRAEFDKSYRKELDKNIARREKLIERAESLSETEDLAIAVREINKLHNEWKKLANLPKDQNDALWERFKAASDKFNEIKSDNQDTIRDQEKENLEHKERLCKEVDKLIEQEDWKKSTKKMDALFSEWKKVGPVPRKKSGDIWRQFRKRMDIFYKNRRDYFKEARKEQTENLNKKREIVAKIKELAKSEDLEAALKEVQTIQEEYKKIGFVPIKQKDKIWDQYREACDIFYDALRASGGSGAPQSGGGRKGGGGRSSSAEKQLTSEIFRLRKEADGIREQILKYADTKTYFKPNKKGMELINEIQGNIDEAEVKLEEKNKRIEELQAQLRELDED